MSESKKPQADEAEHGAYFPSVYSLGQYVPAKSDFDGGEKRTVTEGPKKILAVMVDERYLPVEGEALFSTGNHPIETLVPLMHLSEAGYEIEIATPSGLMGKFEYWAFPKEDDAVKDAFETLLPKIRNPKNSRTSSRTSWAPTASTRPSSFRAVTVR